MLLLLMLFVCTHFASSVECTGQTRRPASACWHSTLCSVQVAEAGYNEFPFVLFVQCVIARWSHVIVSHLGTPDQIPETV